MTDRRVQPLGQPHQTAADERPPGVLAGHDRDTPGPVDALDQRRQELVGWGRAGSLFQRRRGWRWARQVDVDVEHAERNLQVHRAGPPGEGDLKGAFQCRWDLVRVLYPRGPFRDRFKGALQKIGIVNAVKRLLLGVASDPAAEVDDRRGGGVCPGDTGEGVGRAGSGRGQRDAGPAGQPRVHLGSDRGGVLVLDGDGADVRRIGEGVVEVDDMVAVQAKERLYPVCPEALDYELAWVHLWFPPCILTIVRGVRWTVLARCLATSWLRPGSVVDARLSIAL